MLSHQHHTLASKRPKALLFDMDGTILEPIEDGLPEYKARWGIGPSELVVPKLPHLPQAAHDEFASLEDRVAKESRLRPGVHELLAIARQTEVRLALVTNNARSSAKTVIAKHGLAFDLVLSREDTAMKPSPEMLLKAISHFGLAPNDALMIGDTRPDLEAAQAAGLPACVLISAPWNETLERTETKLFSVRLPSMAELQLAIFG